jgi:hypothetical protein
MKIFVVGDYWSESEEDPGTGNWDHSWYLEESFDPTYLSIKGVIPRYGRTSNSYSFETSADLIVGKTYWYVGVVSGDGDTFGHHSGIHEPVDIFETYEDASAVESLIRDVREKYDNVGGHYDYGSSFFMFKGQKYSVSQIIGYFNSLEGVVIKALELQP